jgi:hypothetical protein
LRGRRSGHLPRRERCRRGRRRWRGLAPGFGLGFDLSIGLGFGLTVGPGLGPGVGLRLGPRRLARLSGSRGRRGAGFDLPFRRRLRGCLRRR